MKNLGPLIKKIDIYFLTGIPLILGILMIPFGCKLLSQFGIPCNDFEFNIIGIIGLITMSLAGFAQIYRREAPGFHPNYPIRGKVAVFVGWIWVIFCWGGVIYVLYSFVQ